MILSKIWQIISLLVISSSTVFSASNVCPRMENYTVTSMESYTEPVVVNTFTWCLQIPPRCPKTRTEMRQRYRVKEEVRSRSVNECCEGYRMLSTHDAESAIRCVPFCENCLLGVCVSPNECKCLPGYRGDDCESKCLPGTWGSQCRTKCNCGKDVPCSPTNGECVCPPGLQGQTCNEPCPDDLWGPGCVFSCDCKNSSNVCHSENGTCIEVRDVSTEITSLLYSPSTTDDYYEASNVPVTEYSPEPTKVSQSTERTVEDTDNREIFTLTNDPPKTTNPETIPTSSWENLDIRTQPPEDEGHSTTRPVIFLVSAPERRRNFENDLTKFSMKNPFLRHVDDSMDLQEIGSPKTDYVKTVYKDDIQPTPIPLDIALIVVASIVSLGLTSVAVVMVLHMRSKLFEAARLSIYEDEKTKSQTCETGRLSTIVAGGLPPTPIRLSPMFATGSEPATILTLNGIDPSSHYANGAATIGLRIPGNLRDFLQDDHYDRPPATLIRLQAEFDANTEHVYDEIPLQSTTPLCVRKNA